MSQGIYESNGYYENDRDGYRRGGGSFWVFVLLGVLFLPAVIVGFIFAQFLRKGRMRPTVIFSLLIAIDFVVILWMRSNEVLPRAWESLRDFVNLGSNWGELIPAFVSVNFIAGTIGAAFWVIWAHRQMITNPWLLTSSNNWMEGFEYRKTPLQTLKRKRNVKKLQKGELQALGRAPLGIDEDSGKDNIVYRYDDEAIKHTLITGLPGSGKALHKDTLIPTKKGFKTVEQVIPGDIGYDENGIETTFIDKFQPMTEDHYELTIDGTKVKACGDHLWEVELLREFKKYGYRQDFLFDENSIKILQKWRKGKGKTITTKDLSNIGIKSGFVLTSLLDTVTPVYMTGTTVEKTEIIRFLKNECSDTKFQNENTSREEVLLAAERLPDKVTTSTLNAREHEILKFLPARFKGIEVLNSSKEKVYDRAVVASTIIEEQERRNQQNVSLDSRKENERSFKVMSTREIFELLSNNQESRPLLAIRRTKAVQYDKKELLIDPYLLGAWIGDGYSRTGSISSVDPEIIDYISKSDAEFTTVETVLPSGKTFYKWRVKGLLEKLRELNILQETTEEGSQKDIPNEYLESSIEQRVELIKGLMDTDGTIDSKGICSFGVTNEKVVNKVNSICKSLGWKTTDIRSKVPYAKLSDGTRRKGKTIFSFSFYPDLNIFNVKRKYSRLEKRLTNNLKQQVRHDRIYIESIKEIEDSPEDYYCFTVDSPKSLFLCTEDYIPTHNSISMMSMMKSDIEEGKSVVGIDFKRDPELASKLATWAKENGRNFYHFVNGEEALYDIANSPGQAFYNPLAAGTPTSKADMLLSMREYDSASAVYKAAMTQVLQILFNMEHYVTMYGRRKNLKSVDWDSGGFYTLVSLLSGNNLNELADQCTGTPIQDEALALAQAAVGRTQEAHALDELRGQLRTITASEYGPWMRLQNAERNIDIFDLTKDEGNVILFSLNSDSEPEFAKYMGGIILSDITSVSAKRRNEDVKNQIHVYVDEFQIVNPDSIKGLLEKARASGMAVTLAQQSLEQIVASSTANGEAYLGSVLDTCGNFIIHFGATEPSAIKMAEIIGRDFFPTYTIANRNETFFGRINWSNRRNQNVIKGEEERWIYEPLRFMKLDSPSSQNGYRSTAVVINKTSLDGRYKGRAGAKARKVWMIPDNEVLQEYYVRDTSRVFVPKEIVSSPSAVQSENSLERRANPVSAGGVDSSYGKLSSSTSDISLERREQPMTSSSFADESSMTPTALSGNAPQYKEQQHPIQVQSQPTVQQYSNNQYSHQPSVTTQQSLRDTTAPPAQASTGFEMFGKDRMESDRRRNAQRRPSASSFEQLSTDIR